MAGTFVLTDTLDKVFDDLFADGEREVDAQVQGEVALQRPLRRRRPARADSTPSARRRRSRPSTASPAAEPVRHHLRLRQHQPGPRRRRRADRRVAGAADAARELDRRRAAHALRVARRAGAPRPTTRSPSTWPPSKTPASRSATRSRSVTQFGREQYTLVGIVHLRHGEELGRRHVRRLHARRGAAPRRHRRADPERAGRRRRGRLRGGAGRRASSRSCPTAPRPSPARRPPPSCPTDVQAGFAFFQSGAHRLRRHRAARRRVRDLQHLLDPRGPAHPRAGAAAGRRRQPRPGARLGAARGRPRRAGGRRARPRRRASGWPRASPPRSRRPAPTCPPRRWSCAPARSCSRSSIGLRRHAGRRRWSPPSGPPGCRRWPPCATSPSTGPGRRRLGIALGVVVLARSARSACRPPGRGRRHRMPSPPSASARCSSIVGAIVIGPVLAGPQRRGARRRRSRAARASPGSWPPRTPPAAPSAPRPPRPR